LRRRRFAAAEAVLAVFHNAPPVDAPAFRYDLDRHVSQDIEPRA
jgi:hypothetical protein